MARNKTVFCLLLISLFPTSSLATDNVDKNAIGFCHEKKHQELMIHKCWANIAKGKPESKPSKQCCDAIKKIHQFNCFCELNQYPHKWDVDIGKVDVAVEFCTGRKDLGSCLLWMCIQIIDLGNWLLCIKCFVSKKLICQLEWNICAELFSSWKVIIGCFFI